MERIENKRRNAIYIKMQDHGCTVGDALNSFAVAAKSKSDYVPGNSDNKQCNARFLARLAGALTQAWRR